MPSKRCYLYPWLMLRRAWLHYQNEWKQKYRIVEAANSGYTTISVAVPIEVIGQAVKTAMIIDVSAQFNEEA